MSKCDDVNLKICHLNYDGSNRYCAQKYHETNNEINIIFLLKKYQIVNTVKEAAYEKIVESRDIR